MKKSILILLLFSSFFVVGQNYSHVGAIGHYSLKGFMPHDRSYLTLETVKDTMINSYSSQVLKEVRYNTLGNAYDSSYFYISSTDSMVYDFNPSNNFSRGLLYDFTLDVGDSMIISNHIAMDTLVLYLDSISSVMINGISRQVQYFSQNQFGVGLNSPIIEGVGSSWYFFPTGDNDPRHDLRCYQDNTFGYYKHPDTDTCDAVVVSLEEHIDLDNQIEIYPNPAEEQIVVKSKLAENATFIYSIYDAQGAILIDRNKHRFNEELNLQKLNSGKYFIKFYMESGEEVTKSIIIM